MTNTQYTIESLRELNSRLVLQIDEIRKKFTEIEIENNEIKKKYVEELERYKKENEKRFEKLECIRSSYKPFEAPTGNSPKEDTYASNIKSSVPSNQKKERGLIQEISIKDQNNITEISSNNIPQNHVPEIDYSTSDKDIICLYQNACDAEKDAIKANREEILCWCFYAK
ncbi:793_t:CDS:2, partial [Entrophospora sp. SA101]